MYFFFFNKIKGVFMAVTDSVFPTKYNPIIDQCCIIPVIQQGIGICGTLFSLTSLTGNVAERILKECDNTCGKHPLPKQDSQIKKFRTLNDQSRKEHLQFLALNLARCVPIAGSVISYNRFLVGLSGGLATAGRTC